MGGPVVSMVILPLFYADNDSTQFRTSISGFSESTSEPVLFHKVHLGLNPEIADTRRRRRKEVKWMKTIDDKGLMV